MKANCQSFATIVELCFSAASGNVDNVRKILDSGTEVNSVDYDRRTALHIAASEGHLEVAKLLLSRKADVNIIDRWGHNALDEATRGGFAALQDLLREAGATKGTGPGPKAAARPPRDAPAAAPEAEGQLRIDPTMQLCCAAAAGELQLVQELHRRGADLNVADYDGRTALHVASAHGHFEVVQWLLQSRADFNRHDSFGLTPLSEAVRLGKERVATLLAKMDSKSICTEAIRHSANTGQWAIPLSDIKIGEVFRRTQASILYRATWRGTKVVAKTSSRLTTSTSGTCLVDMANNVAPPPEVINEIAVLSTLRHPDLVMFLGACFEHRPPFFLTEYMEGGDLESHYALQARGQEQPYRPPVAHVISWACAVARALSFLHNCSLPIIHRDLKPANLLLTDSKAIKVANFGFSRIMGPQRQGRHIDGGGQGAEHTECNADWAYAAPEVLRSETYSDKADIFSFALVLWFMCTGRRPFVEQFGDDMARLLSEYKKGTQPRPELSAGGRRCGRQTPALRELIQDCWREVPATRPSAQECTQRMASICTAAPKDLLSTLKTPFAHLFHR